jgi:hypothetical protein
MEIRFELDTDSLTVGDMLLIEDAQDGKRPFHGMTTLMARFLADENGALLGQEAGVKVLSALKMAEFNQVSKAFGEAIQRKAVPPTTNAG